MNIETCLEKQGFSLSDFSSEDAAYRFAFEFLSDDFEKISEEKQCVVTALWSKCVSFVTILSVFSAAAVSYFVFHSVIKSVLMFIPVLLVCLCIFGMIYYISPCVKKKEHRLKTRPAKHPIVLCALISFAASLLISAASLSLIHVIYSPAEQQPFVPTHSVASSTVTVNKVSGCYHIFSDCPAAEKISDENRLLFDEDEFEDSMEDDWYLCKQCEKRRNS